MTITAEELALALIALLMGVAAARAVGKAVWPDDDGVLISKLDVAPPANLTEPLCSQVLACGHVCRCALGHAQRCACWRADCVDGGAAEG